MLLRHRLRDGSLRNYSLADGEAVAERMREAIEETDIKFQGRKLSVAISIGAAREGQFDTIDAAIQDADAALYRAKRAGCNQTVMQTAHCV